MPPLQVSSTALALACLLVMATAQNGTQVSTDLTVCVVERAPFCLCSISDPAAWTPSFMVSLFKEVLDGVNDTSVKATIRPDWQCVGRSTPDLIDELARPADTRSCDILIAPITINDERRSRIKFVNGIYYSYALPVGPAQDQSDKDELAFWLKPFQTAAWLTNLGLLLGLGVVGGLLALLLNAKFGDTPAQQLGTRAPTQPTGPSSPRVDDSSSSSHLKDYAILSTGSITSIFGQHPSHGLFAGPDTRGIAVAMAAFFAASVFSIGVVSMMYAGNLASIQTQSSIVPLYDSLADLYGQKVLTSAMYGAYIPYNLTVVPFFINNNEDVLNAIRDVDAGKVDAFVWDALGVLTALEYMETQGEDVCVYALKKRVLPFEIGIGVGNDVAQNVIDALQTSLNAMDGAGRLRDLRKQYLDGDLSKYIGRTVCPSAAQGLSAGQTAGVYIVPAIVLGLIAVYAAGYLAVMKLRRRRQARRASSADSAKESTEGVYYPSMFRV